MTIEIPDYEQLEYASYDVTYIDEEPYVLVPLLDAARMDALIEELYKERHINSECAG